MSFIKTKLANKKKKPLFSTATATANEKDCVFEVLFVLRLNLYS